MELVTAWYPVARSPASEMKRSHTYTPTYGQFRSQLPFVIKLIIKQRKGFNNLAAQN
jgi:hypothetical protein